MFAFSWIIVMPIRRPADLPPLTLPPLATQTGNLASRDHLREYSVDLAQQMRDLPKPEFHPATDPLDYAALQQVGFALMSHGFLVHHDPLDVFIHARRELGHGQGKFNGDKFHLSVQQAEVPAAFGAIAGLLFSEHCPFDKWKVTDMARADPASRVSVGAQWTLYAKPEAADSGYRAQELFAIRCFVEALEAQLAAHGIAPGVHPQSDVRPAHWHYLSYRNELRSDRYGGAAQNEALRDEPFYSLMTR
ncbi:type III effector phosphothreonine lyase [Paludibacterium paludis]|nr:type III effector phosphothreonine lyase [Paludibacterium paludis]